jgi:hypothetical protein
MIVANKSSVGRSWTALGLDGIHACECNCNICTIPQMGPRRTPSLKEPPCIRNDVGATVALQLHPGSERTLAQL